LLKNDIEQHEYWLVTKSLQSNTPADFAQWMKWDSSVKQTESGEVAFHYTQLGQLKNEITPEPLPQPELSKKVKMISVSKEYETDIITLFHLIGDFNNRSRWQEGVKKVEEISHFLPRVGMRCRCTLENGEVVIYSTSYSYNPERIEFSEIDEKTKNLSYFILEKISDNKTRLTIDLYQEKNIAKQIIFELLKKKKLKDTYQKSLMNLEELIKEIKISA